MSGWDDPDDVLRAPELSDDVVEGLLDGTLEPEDAPIGYEDVAALLHAASGPGSSDELTGSDAAVAALMSPASGATGDVDELAGRRRRAVSGPVKAVVAGIVAATAIGGAAAAATGHLSIPGVSRSPVTTSIPASSSSGTQDRVDAEPRDRRREPDPVTSSDVPAPPATPGSLPGDVGPGAASAVPGGDDAAPGRSGDANPGGQSTTGATASADKGSNGNGSSKGNGSNGSSKGNGSTNGNRANAGGGTPATTPPAAGGNGQGAVNGQGVGASNGVGTANAPTDPADRSRRP